MFQGTTPASTILLTPGRDVLLAAVIIPAGVTLLFAVWEYLEFRFRYSERWKPEALAQAKSLATLNQMIASVLVLTCIIVGLDFWRRFIRTLRRSNSHPRTADSTS